MQQVAAERLLKNVAATLSWQPIDYTGEATAPGGAVTVDLTRADGTVLVTGGATSGTGSNPRTYSLAAASNTLLDLITATWKEAGTARGTTIHEIVGGFYFSIAALRAFDSTITAAKYPDGDVLTARREVEDELERITGTAWVPRYFRDRISGSGTDKLILPAGIGAVRSVRSVREYDDATTFTAYTATELAAIDTSVMGMLTRLDGDPWAKGTKNILVELEHGYDQLPADLARATKQRARFRLNMEKSGVPDVADRFVRPDGSVYEVEAIDDIEQRQVLRTYMGYRQRTPLVG